MTGFTQSGDVDCQGDKVSDILLDNVEDIFHLQHLTGSAVFDVYFVLKEGKPLQINNETTTTTTNKQKTAEVCK